MSVFDAKGKPVDGIAAAPPHALTFEGIAEGKALPFVGLSVINPGERVKLHVGSGASVDATVSSVCVDCGPRVTYRCYWWDGCRLCCEWVDACMVSPADDAPRLVIGFGGPP